MNITHGFMNLSDIPELTGPPVCIQVSLEWGSYPDVPVETRLGWFAILLAAGA